VCAASLTGAPQPTDPARQEATLRKGMIAVNLLPSTLVPGSERAGLVAFSTRPGLSWQPDQRDRESGFGRVLGLELIPGITYNRDSSERDMATGQGEGNSMSPRSQAVDPTPGGAAAVLRTLLLTDLVDSTHLVDQLGDARAFAVVTQHDRVARDLLPLHNGVEIDKADGFLIMFERPVDAVGYALAYHQALAELSLELSVQLRARAGIHMGEVFLRENEPDDVARGAKPLEVEGLAKVTAARVMSLAGGRQTLITEGAFKLARQAAESTVPAGGELLWLAHGPYLFKGVSEPIGIFEVGVLGESLLEVPTDTAKAHRAVAAGEEITLGWRPGPGQEIPRRSGWILEKQLGEGGFGEVWQATQKETGEQRVFKFCYEADRLRALQREVTFFRLLKRTLGDRPEIVRLLDWSFEQAPYFLEMEYIEGCVLAAWAAERGGLSQVPTGERLEIIAQVAEALSAAHSVGILHKDIKPRNILISCDHQGACRAKLADFGISQIVDREALLAKGITVMGLTDVVPDSSSPVIGSHHYMAPEVSEGKVATIQADIYSLGVILYQMIVGDLSHALAPGWRRDVADGLLAEDIALMVDGRPEKRPASALEVADRLRRLDERRTRRAARLRRKVLRRRLRFHGAVAAVVLLVVTIVAVQAIRARRQADRLRGQAEDLVSFMLGDLYDRLEPIGRLDVLDSAGEEVLKYYESLQEDEITDTSLAKHVKALNKLGDVRMAQGNLGGALVYFQKSLQFAKALHDRDPNDPQRKFDLGQSHFWVGDGYLRLGGIEDALTHMQRYLDLSLDLVEHQPNNSDWQFEVACGHTNIADVLTRSGEDLALAGKHYRKALEISRELVALKPDSALYRIRLAKGNTKLGIWMETSGSDLPLALSRYEEALEELEDLVDLDPTNMGLKRQLTNVYDRAGNLAMQIGEATEATRYLQCQKDLCTDLTSIDPSNVEWQEICVNNHINSGIALSLQGFTGQALERYGAALHGTSDRPEIQRLQAAAHNQMGRIYLDSGNLSRALEAAQRAHVLIVQLAEARPNDRSVLQTRAECHLLEGDIHAAQGRYGEAEDSWQHALEAIRPIAQTSAYYRLLDPWIRAKLSLGQYEEVKTQARLLLDIGYRGRLFIEKCDQLDWNPPIHPKEKDDEQEVSHSHS
jgi:serine/threonine-protein kinase